METHFGREFSETIKRHRDKLSLALAFVGVFACTSPKPEQLDIPSDPSGVTANAVALPKQVAESVSLPHSASEIFRQVDSKEIVQKSGDTSIRSREELHAEIDKQKAWLTTYLDSDMYKQRLEGELVRAHVGQSTEERNRIVKKMISDRKANLAGSHYKITNQIDPKGQLWVLGFYASKVETGVSLHSPKLGTETKKPFLLKKGDVVFESTLASSKAAGYETIPVHEFSHASTDGDARLLPESMREIQKYAQKDFSAIFKDKNSGILYGYMDDPTEIKARFDALRYLLNKYGIYNASKDVFTEEHLKQLLRTKEIREDQNVKDIFETIMKDQEGVIWMMNNIAGLDQVFPSEETQKLA